MKSLMKKEKGFTLIEVLVALLILAIIGTGFLMALTIASKAIIIADERTTAESLARSQMEYVKDLDYAVLYSEPPIPSEYTDAGYSATIDVESLPDPENPGSNLVGIQKITVTVYHDGNEVLTLEDYKVDR